MVEEAINFKYPYMSCLITGYKAKFQVGWLRPEMSSFSGETFLKSPRNQPQNKSSYLSGYTVHSRTWLRNLTNEDWRYQEVICR